jgi:predicted SnoaL-like aldol condensation-catalyzing enzyme
MKNKKEIALSFLRLASSGQVDEAYEKFIHPSFHHHNAYFAPDRESLMRGMKENAKQFPGKIFESIRALEDGDLVAVHGRVRLTPGGTWIALMHIFRFEGDQIIEEWEVGQEVPKDMVNADGMF